MQNNPFLLKPKIKKAVNVFVTNVESTTGREFHGFDVEEVISNFLAWICEDSLPQSNAASEKKSPRFLNLVC